MLQPWTIGVLSTDYDLHDYREAIITKLKKKNIRVSAFESPDFPVEPDKHSHDACLIALKRTQIVLLVIDKRFGGIYYDSTKDVSITEEEYLSAVKKGIPCLVFVKKEAWADRYAYSLELKNSGKEPKEFEKGYTCKYVSDIKTIHFIDLIRKAYEDKNHSNWITTFDNIPDLLNKIEGKLKGLSRFWIKQIVNKQKDDVMARKTSTSFSMSLGDIFSKNYYVEPEYCIESGSMFVDGIKLETAIVREISEERSLLVYGEAGYGKTTILTKCFLDHVENFNKDEGYEIPFYIWLKGKTSEYHFDFLKYMEECFETYYKREPYPYLDIASVSPFFYLDGFDEIAEKITTEEVNRISTSTIFASPMLLTSRYQYALRYLENYELANKFDIRIKIEKWDIEKAKSYIDNFCKIKKKDQDFVKKIYVLLADNRDLSNILDNPLLITMLLWIIEANRMDIPETIFTRVELFQECFKELARREIHRANIKSLDESALVFIWSNFAWLVYREKILGKKAKMKTLLSVLKNKYLSEYGEKCNESLLEVVFDTRGEFVFGTFHEQFLEFLVANTLFYACLEKRIPYPEFLQYVVRPEINRYFRALWNESTDNEKETIYKNIFEQYMKNLGCEENLQVSTRVHAIYHITRLDSKLREENIKRAFTIEKNISVMLSLYFGAIKMGKLIEEEQFYNLLIGNEEYNLENRGYHLAYYSDISSEGEMPFLDTGESDWGNTLKAFIRHFESTKRGQYYLRRIDLVTMRQLMEARKSTGPLTKKIVDELENLTYNPIIQDEEEFQKKIECAFCEMKAKYEEFYKE